MRKSSVLLFLLYMHESTSIVRPIFPPPSKDPFMRPTSGFEGLPNGSILKSREMPKHAIASLSTFPQNIKKVFQFLYRTTDALGNPTSAVTTLLVPFNADSRKLVSYQIAIDSPCSDCAASYSFLRGNRFFDGLAQVEILIIDTLLSRGWIVSVPDYLGEKSLFSVGAMGGHGVLDSVRAVLASNSYNATATSTEIDPDADIQLWGYSGGAHSTGWASQLHPSYAPELNIIGAAFGGIAADLNLTFNSVDATFNAGLIPAGLHGMMNQYPEVRDYIDSSLRPEKRDAFYKAKEMCFIETLLYYAYHDFSTYMTSSSYLDHPIIKQVTESNVMGRLDTPRMPLFFYHSKQDEMIPFASVQQLYSTWCQNGASIEMVQDDRSIHIQLHVTGAANAILFLERRFNGEPAQQGCTSRSTTCSLLDPGALAVFGKNLLDALKGILGRPLGSARNRQS